MQVAAIYVHAIDLVHEWAAHVQNDPVMDRPAAVAAGVDRFVDQLRILPAAVHDIELVVFPAPKGKQDLRAVGGPGGIVSVAA